MEMKKQAIQNIVGILHGDVIVDVDIRFLPMSPSINTEERLSLEQVNRDFGILAHEIRQEIREKINKYFQD